MEEQLRADALEYHLRPTPGKISVTPTKGLATSATCRSRIRPASPTPAPRSTPTRAMPRCTPRAATSSPW